MNHLSIACKHPIPNWRERTEFLSAPYRGRPYSSKQQIRHVDVEEEYDGFQNDNFSIDDIPIQLIHAVNTAKYSQRSKELEERIHTTRMTLKRSRQKGSAIDIRKRKQYFTHINLGSMADIGHLKNTKFQVDTATTCNTIHMNDLEGIVDICDPEFGIKLIDTIINMYNSAAVKPAGVIDLVCMRNKYCPSSATKPH